MHPAHLFLALLLTNSAGALTSTVVHEKRVDHPSLIHSRRLEGDVEVPLRIGLKQQNTEDLAEHLLSVSDPQSPHFGQHWSPGKVAQVFAPSNESTDAVIAWLSGQACDSYSLPAHIAHHIDIITPTVQPNIKLGSSSTHPSKRSIPPRKRSAPVLPAGCDQAFTPACIRSLYNMTYVPKATDRNSFGIVSQAPATYLQSDLDTFFANFSPAWSGSRPWIVDAVEGTEIGEDGWILQYTMTLVEPQPVTMLQVGTLITGNFISFNEWLDAVDGSYCTSDGGDDLTYDPQFPNLPIGDFQEHSCGTVKPPYVISNSRADFEYRLSPFYTQRQCNEFGKHGRDSVVFRGKLWRGGHDPGILSDDNGSLRVPFDNENYLSIAFNSGSVNLNATHFNPGWPATCPWITSVGGTQVKANASGTSANGVALEEVWNQDLTHGFWESGGGGFSASNRFPMPQYQKAAVNSFLGNLKKTNPEQLNHFNPRGRAYPDISANANNFVAVEDGAFSLDSGTSGATPTVASIITLVNDARLAAGKSPVGFINPSIYSPHFASAFNDIVSGTSQGCKGWQGDRGGGFQAVPGWDAASGLGTPNLGVLIEKWLMLP
ncbi:subtilisin-like protein [Hymenopellis radicata]|nr:subtilisin-like protein [Hymenopellis radicata]